MFGGGYFKEAPKAQEAESNMEKFCKHDKQIGNCDQCMMSDSEALADAEKVKMAARAHKGFMGYDIEGKREPSGTDYSEGERWIREGIVEPGEVEKLAEFQRKLEEEIRDLKMKLDTKERYLSDIKKDPRKYLDS